jgi:mitochondrial enoyl-[acyl-carrier protein] reductase / trans-2-enoyl-CoA reductase
MLRLVGSDAHLVTYGAMARAPLSIPAGVQIFQGLTAHGFWQSRWYKSHSRTEREELFAQLTELMRNGKVRVNIHKCISTI